MNTTPNQVAKNDRLVWVDCEMTGLDPDQHVLVEIAVIVTDADLTPLDEGLDLVVHAAERDLARMNAVVTKMHGESGLTEQIRSSDITLEEAEEQVLDYVKKHVPTAGVAPLAGNTISADRKFINRYMPHLDQYLHYRMIDVSSLKELARRWYPHVYNGQPAKGMAHRALADIKESIRELDYYRRAMLVEADPSNADATAAAKAATERFPI